MLTITDETEQPTVLPKITDDRSLDNIHVDAYETRLKAQKVHYALGDNSPGLEPLQAQFQTGDEDGIRASASALETFRNFTVRRDMVDQITQSATQHGRPLSFEEEELLRGLSVEQLSNPKNILEKLFAREYTNRLAVENAEDADPLLPQVQEELGPDGTNDMLDAFEAVATKQEIAHDIHRKVKAKYDQTSNLRWGWDLAKTMVPTYESIQMHDVVKDVDTTLGNILPGSNLADQIQGLYFLPPDEFRAKAEEVIDYLMGFNVVLAMDFADKLISYSSGTEFWGNVFGVADAVDVGLSAVPTAGAKALRMAARLKAAGRANASPKMSSSDARAAAGDVAGAARDRAYVFIQEGQTMPGVSFMETPPASMNDNTQRLLPGILDPQNSNRSPGTIANERARRLTQAMDEVEKNLQKLSSDVQVVPRLSEPQAIAEAFRLAEAEFRKIYHRVEDSIVDVVPERISSEQYGSVDQIAVYLGKPDATAFDVAEQAQYWANRYWLKAGSYDIVERDGNVFIKMTKVVDETDPVVMQLRLATDAPPEESWINAILGWGRSPDDILSPDHRMYRHVATYGGTEALRFVRAAMEPIAKLSKRQNDRLREILHANHFEMREYPQPDGTTKLLPGNRYDTPEEFEQAYLSRFGEMPDEVETTGYFTVQKLNDWDLYMRRVQRRQDKARLGGEQKSLRIVTRSPDGRTSRRYTEYFEGRTVRGGLPWDSGEEFTVAFHDGTKVRTFLHSPQKPMFRREREKLQKILDEGAFVIQPFPSAQRYLGEWAGSRGTPIDYVISKDVRTKPLDLLSQVEARYGGHGVVPDGRFIKQAVIHNDRFGRRLHSSDRTMFYFPDEKSAKQHLAALEKARQMVNEGNTGNDLYDHLVRNTPFRSVDEFMKYDIRNGGQYDFTRPFFIARSGETSANMAPTARGFGEDVKSLENSAHNPLRGSHVKYTQEREGAPWTIENVGTEANPDFKFTQGPIMEPYEAILRAQGELLSSRFFRDYTIREAEKWAHRYVDMFKGSAGDMLTDPIGTLRNPNWADNKFKNLPRWQQAMNERRAILQLIGSPTVERKVIGWFRDKMLKEKAIDSKLWTEKSDPVGMMRGAVFDAFLGLWNARHYFLNASAVSVAAAITGNPIRASQANILAWMMRANRMGDWHPGYSNKFGDFARDLFGMSKDEYKQMYEAARRAGVMRMEGETAQVDHLFDRPILRSRVEKGREAARFFFKEGDIFNRMTAWNIAYLEWRSGTGGFAPGRTRGTSGYVPSGPDAKLTRDVEAALLRRTSDLTNNQTRASNNPAYQRGLPSIPTQFITWQARLQDLMWGKRLTHAEKARLVTLQSVLWGGFAIPGAYFGAAVPVYEWTREWALENGLDTIDHPMMKVALNGGVSYVLEKMLGREFNVGESYGPGGFSLLSDVLLEGNFYALGGSIGRTVKDWVDSFDPFAAFAMDMMVPPTSGRTAFKLKPEDFIGIFDEISSVRNTYRLWMAHKYGQLITKSGFEATELNTREALLGLLTGLYPQDYTDARIGRDILKDEENHRKEAVNDAIKYSEAAMRAWQQGDMAEGEAQWARVFGTLSIAFNDDPEGFDNAMKSIMRRSANGPFYDDVVEQLAKRAPAGQRDTHFKRWERRVFPKLRGE